MIIENLEVLRKQLLDANSVSRSGILEIDNVLAAIGVVGKDSVNLSNAMTIMQAKVDGALIISQKIKDVLNSTIILGLNLLPALLVPNVVGMIQQDAINTLTAINMLYIIDSQFNQTIASGIVISQNIIPGEYITSDISIVISVSQGIPV